MERVAVVMERVAVVMERVAVATEVGAMVGAMEEGVMGVVVKEVW